MFLNSTNSKSHNLYTSKGLFKKEKKKKKGGGGLSTFHIQENVAQTLAGWYYTGEEKYSRNNFVTTIHWENIYNWVFES